MGTGSPWLPDGSDENEDSDPWRAALEHARFHWKAEEENARRLGRRTNLQLTVIAAFLGFGFVHLFQGPTLEQSTLEVVLRVVVSLGLFLLAWAAALLLALLPEDDDVVKERWWVRLLAKLKRRFPWLARLIGRKERRNPASTKMSFGREHLPDLETEEEPDPGTEKFAIYLTFTLMADAAADLEEQNLIQNDRVDRGQQLMVVGFSLIILALGVYSIAPAEPEGPQDVRIVTTESVDNAGQTEPQEEAGASDGEDRNETGRAEPEEERDSGQAGAVSASGEAGSGLRQARPDSQ